MPVLESRVEGCWAAKQTAKGSPATTIATQLLGKRFRKVGGALNVNRDDANENYADGQRFNTASDFVNTLVGDGSPVVQGHVGAIAYLFYLLNGQETVTGAGDPYTHVGTPLNTGGFWSTWWKSVGASVGPLKQKFNDCRLISLRIEASTAQKVLHLTATWISLDAGEIFTTDPVVADEGIAPFLFTEGQGAYTIDGTVYTGESSFVATISDGITAAYGDDVVPNDIALGMGTIELESITLLLNAAGLARYYTQIYGTASPTAGTKPLKTAPALGSYSFDLTRGANREFKFEVPGVYWTPDLSIEGNPDGGLTEIPLAGHARSVAGQPMYRSTVKCPDAAYT